MTGRGEIIEPLGWQPPGWVVLMMPELEISTAAVYKAWRPEDVNPRGERMWWTDPPATVELLDACCFNDLRAAAERVCPALGVLREKLTAIDIGRIHLSGSGAAMFALAPDRRQAQVRAQRAAKETGVRTDVASYYPRQ